ncbi:hypothetical protein [Acetobacter sp. LMG 32666]|uniref:hypothetical protein n=1 Tax=Acetobacter sp. LMG 32666 TaxID=2959295 RepID=UPI0030C826EF
MSSEQDATISPAQETIETILNDPAASDWLKACLQSALTRDAVDAANDAQHLAEVLVARSDQLLHHVVHPHSQPSNGREVRSR